MAPRSKKHDRDKNAKTNQSIHFEAKTESQRKYIELIDNHDIIIATGIAGTGRTFISTAMALEYLFSNKCDKIVVTRPVVEAGEKLGYLPGSPSEKIKPYLVPIYDTMHQLVDQHTIKNLEQCGKICIVPLAYARGISLKNTFIIVDEAQNCTNAQLKLIITRLGENSKIVINGDEKQSDIKKELSGLSEHMAKLKNIHDRIVTFEFDENDVVRHPLISVYLKAIES